MIYKLTEPYLPKKSSHYGKDVLSKRGIEDIEDYLQPTSKALIEPTLLTNITRGMYMLNKHLRTQKPIFLQIDSDMDGYMSATIMYLYIKKHNPDKEIIWRVHEGKQHGIILDTIPDGIGLVIIPDAGSNQTKEHNALIERGIDTLVLDHHDCTKEPSQHDRICVINNQISRGYKNKSLCGAGVALKFCQYIDTFYNVEYAEDLYDLAAAGLVGDMMDLRNIETRYMVNRGLKNITNIGLKALVTKQIYSIKDVSNVTPTHIAFYITPLVNAIVRVGTQEEKETMFLAFIDGDGKKKSTKRGAKESDFETNAEQTARVATNARNRQNRIKEKAIDILIHRIDKDELYKNPIIFIPITEEDEIPNTLTGLVAMNLMNKYNVPVLIGRENEEGVYKGSARADNNSKLANLKDFLQDSGYFDLAEGHQAAHGIAIKKTKVEGFLKYVNEQFNTEEIKEKRYLVDYIFDYGESLEQLVLQIGNMAHLWGQGVPEPKIVIRDIPVKKLDFSFMGKNKDRVKFTCGGVTFITFRNAKLKQDLEDHASDNMTIIGRANLNEWLGTVYSQMVISEINFMPNNGF